jgi:hypothetical protein
MDRDRLNLALLRQTIDSGLSLPEIARQEIFGGADFSGVFRHPIWGKFFEHHTRRSGDALPGGISYVTATVAGYAFVGSNKERVNNSSAALSLHLPVYWFCHAETRRYLISQSEAEGILGITVPNNVPYVIERGPENRIYRIYISTSDVSKTMQHVEKILGPATIAVLAETQTKVEAIAAALEKKKVDAIAALGASLDTIASCLKDRRRES